MKSFNESIKTLYAARGVSVEIILNNVTFNKTVSSTMANKYFVERKNKTFSVDSLIIPMDENQTNPMKAYGFIYNLVDATGTGPLNSTRVPVWDLLQNSVNGSYPDFYITTNTDDNASTSGSGNVMFRKYSGAPFLIENDDLKYSNGTVNETLKQLILAEAKNKGITVHKLKSNLTYTQSVVLLYPPRVAIYPKNDTMTKSVMRPYYKDGEVPYTELSNEDILNGDLLNYDILTIPHHKMTDEPVDVITAIVGWISNGGIIHIECAGTDTMDDAVENNPATKNAKPWYGLIGVKWSQTDEIPDGYNHISHSYSPSNDARYMKLVDNTTRFNASYTYNMSPPIPLAGLADPGAPYDPVAQIDNTSGILGSELSSPGNPFPAATTAFSLYKNASKVNPGTNIIAYSSYPDGTPLYGDYEKVHDGIKEPQLNYVEAPYDNGLVVYIAGHNLSYRGGPAERLIFESFFAASMKRTETMILSATKINVTIKYFDGKVWIEDILEINI
jgi:hypothetical protein